MRRSLAEIAGPLDTDKRQSPGYLEHFERHFGRLRDEPVKLLELGVFHGGSLLMWQEYFEHGLVVGLDLSENPFAHMPDRVRFYRGSQDDHELLDRIARECAPEGFDIVLDDASHVGTLARASFRKLFGQHLKRGGIYVVEDWGTGYWATWSDGRRYRTADSKRALAAGARGRLPGRILKALRARLRSQLATDPDFAAHNFGMVGFVKELVDETAWRDITLPDRGNPSLDRRASLIRELTIHPGHVFVVRA
jgi:hypothetical protein